MLQQQAIQHTLTPFEWVLLVSLALSCQVVANTGGVLGLGMTPHEILPRPGRTIVDVDGVPFKGPKTKHAKWHKVTLEAFAQGTAACRLLLLLLALQLLGIV